VVGQREDGVHVVLDQHHGVVGLEAQQQLDHALGLGHAHAGQRLVEQQHLRSVASVMAISSWRCSPWLAAPAMNVAPAFQPGQFQRFFARSFTADVARALQPAQRVPGLLRIARLRGQAHVFPHGEGQEDVGLLVAAAQALARDLLGRPAGDVVRASVICRWWAAGRPTAGWSAWTCRRRWGRSRRGCGRATDRPRLR
jgi:hypothetical protein